MYEFSSFQKTKRNARQSLQVPNSSSPITIFLAGCPSREGIFVTLLLDYSGSNIAVNERNKIPQKICKEIVLSLESKDYFALGKFDSVFPNPQSLRQVKEFNIRTKKGFANKQCPELLKKSIDLNHPDGTDAYTAWSAFYQAHEERHRMGVASRSTSSQLNYTELVFIVIDALEKADEGKESQDFHDFRESITRFINRGNKVVFFINSAPDLDSLAKKLPLNGIEIHPYGKDGKSFKPIIKSAYSAVRSASVQRND